MSAAPRRRPSADAPEPSSSDVAAHARLLAYRDSMLERLTGEAADDYPVLRALGEVERQLASLERRVGRVSRAPAQSIEEFLAGRKAQEAAK